VSATDGGPDPTVPDIAVPDVVGPGLRILFCGINPSRRSGALGQHFAHPGNRFWKVLFAVGLTDRRLTPAEQTELLHYGIGITNLVARPTQAAADVTTAELRAGAARLTARLAEWRPATLAVVGVQAFRTAFARPRAAVGRQPEPVDGVVTWVLPNPSGLQAHYQMADMVALYAELATAARRHR
jgi:TDG/mug DNA glycosylase family protein